jgi:hypothetical protein
VLAKFHFTVPFELSIPIGVQYGVYGFEVDGYRVTFEVPSMRSGIPAAGHQVTVDGIPGNTVDVLTIVFQKESFNRAARMAAGPPESVVAVPTPEFSLDPPDQLVKRVFRSLIDRLRYASKGAHVLSTDFPWCPWEMQYLNDDGSELEVTPGLVRHKFSKKFSFSYVACTPSIWDNTFSLPHDFAPPAWHTLLLDARNALPHLGTAVVLAATALEVFIGELLDKLAHDTAIPSLLWEWTNDRGDNFTKQPTVEEQFDTLLKVMTGHSMKEDSVLWEAFKNLKSARNRFVHEGLLRVGNAILSDQEVVQLIGHAEAIVARVREWIPEKLRWPVFDNTKVQVEVTVPLLGPPPSG